MNNQLLNTWVVLAVLFAFLLGSLPTESGYTSPKPYVKRVDNFYPPRTHQFCYDNIGNAKYEKKCTELWDLWGVGSSK